MSEAIDGRELLAIRARAARTQDGQHQSLRQTEADRHALVREVYRLRAERDVIKAATERVRAVLDQPLLHTRDPERAGERYLARQVRAALDAPVTTGGES